MNPMPKRKPYRSKAYLAFIRKQPCPYCLQDSEPHHVRRSKWGAGASQKPHDYITVPRCRNHHSPDYEENIELEIIDLLMRYIHEKEAKK